MVTVEIKPNTTVKIEEILNGISKLETGDLESFLKQVAHLLAIRKAPHLSSKETELLLKINEKLPSSLTEKYHTLHKKLQAENITKKEHEELLQIIKIMEQNNVEWTKALVELAQLRKVAPRVLMTQLGINPRANA